MINNACWMQHVSGLKPILTQTKATECDFMCALNHFPSRRARNATQRNANPWSVPPRYPPYVLPFGPEIPNDWRKRPKKRTWYGGGWKEGEERERGGSVGQMGHWRRVLFISVRSVRVYVRLPAFMMGTDGTPRSVREEVTLDRPISIHFNLGSIFSLTIRFAYGYMRLLLLFCYCYCTFPRRWQLGWVSVTDTYCTVHTH